MADETKGLPTRYKVLLESPEDMMFLLENGINIGELVGRSPYEFNYPYGHIITNKRLTGDWTQRTDYDFTIKEWCKLAGVPYSGITIKVEETEKPFLEAGSNTQNLENLEKIMPYFFYDKKWEEIIMETIRTKQEIDEVLKLNKNKRRFFSVNNFISIDPAWQTFMTVVREISTRRQNQLIDQGFMDYTNFQKGRLPDGQKYFKALGKTGHIHPTYIEKITTSKTNGSYFCISRNPIDFLFCSTNQSFSSCLKLNGEYPYYLGIPSAMIDPNRYMIFLFNGKFKRHVIKDYEFKHFRYISRSWCIMGKEKKKKEIISQVINVYPNNRMPLKLLLEQTEHKTGTIYEGWKSFEIPTIKKRKTFLYLDQLRLSDWEGSEAKYTNTGEGKALLIDYKYREGFDSLTEFNQLDPYLTCHECGQTIDDGYEQTIGGIHYCESCYRNRWRECGQCGEMHLKEDITRIGNGNTYCKECLAEYTKVCPDCKRIYRKVRFRKLPYKNSKKEICYHCWEQKFKVCYKCDAVKREQYIKVYEGMYHCKKCYKKRLAEKKKGDKIIFAKPRRVEVSVSSPWGDDSSGRHEEARIFRDFITTYTPAFPTTEDNQR